MRDVKNTKNYREWYNKNSDTFQNWKALIIHHFSFLYKKYTEHKIQDLFVPFSLPNSLACCDSWGRKESDTTEQLNWTEDIVFLCELLYNIHTSYTSMVYILCAFLLTYTYDILCVSFILITRCLRSIRISMCRSSLFNCYYLLMSQDIKLSIPLLKNIYVTLLSIYLK